jgi:hypothetical protein
MVPPGPVISRFYTIDHPRGPTASLPGPGVCHMARLGAALRLSHGPLCVTHGG